MPSKPPACKLESPLLRPLRVSNPLEGISHADLMNQVELFAREKGLEEHTADLKKGALVAQGKTEAFGRSIHLRLATNA